LVSERDKRRYQAADEAARQHGEEQVIRRYGHDTTATWAVKSLLIAAAVALAGYLLIGWPAAISGGVVWLGTAIMLRAYAVRLKHRQTQRPHPSA
jgi:hypothetical protein